MTSVRYLRGGNWDDDATSSVSSDNGDWVVILVFVLYAVCVHWNRFINCLLEILCCLPKLMGKKWTQISSTRRYRTNWPNRRPPVNPTRPT